ncbi:MAG: VirB3 family type IV secretion system protein [Rhodospirillum sp.]|nr:VirB3 family type IV secretion system protein [Rhodospirillum sp.]MCF8501780.1 VirB3 family type IV secretion system protein [Rhodospirillum sp.]
MKAASALLTGAQKPDTTMGIDFRLFMLAGGAGGAMFGGFVVIDVMALALIAGLATILSIWLWAWRRTRADHHFANLLFVAPLFWRGSRKVRHLIGGHKS